VSSTLPGADARGFYQALGIELAGWAQREASVACFAAPDQHARGDRDPSCSVNVDTGAWHCWGCGARGGAYDAALARGRSPREAIDLMVTHGLTTRRKGGSAPSARTVARKPGPRAAASASQRPPARSALVVAEQDLADARARLAALPWPPRVLRDSQRRLWSRTTLLDLECGWERGRVLIPIRRSCGDLRGLLRYAPSHDHAPKVLAARGTRLGLIPHPAAEPSNWIVLVEGPPDMIAARSHDLSAIAVPGDDAWEPGWAQLLTGRQVSVVMDCDRAGRDAAHRIAADLRAVGVHGSIVDLARDHDDGYDLTDWLADRQPLHEADLRHALAAPDTRAAQLRRAPPVRDVPAAVHIDTQRRARGRRR
jgi:Toprim-like